MWQFFAILSFLVYQVELYHRTNASDKEQIFELEDCSIDRNLKLYDDETELPYNAESVRVFMIQDCRNNEEDAKILIHNFLDSYDYKNEMKKCNTDKFVINFMKLSWLFSCVLDSRMGFKPYFT